MEKLRFKFRAWNKEEKIMHYDAEQAYDFMTGKPVINKESFEELLEDKNYIVMQCTGLKVKGKLLYEGDIVYIKDRDVKLYVLWHNDFAGFTMRDIKNKELGANILFGEDREIIGNIYENKELLEG